MKTHLVTFSNKLWYDDIDYYGPSLKKLTESALNHGIDKIHSYNEENLPVSKDILSYMLENRRSGFGFYSWKPIVILDTLQKIPDNDIILYHDVGRPEYNYEIKKDLYPLFNTIIKEYQGIGVVASGWTHKMWCKRYCYQVMGCDNENYWNLQQLTANWNIWQKNPLAYEVVEHWKKWCSHREVVDTNSHIDRSIELDTFNEHRWDQAILTNIIKYYTDLNIGIKPLPFFGNVWEKDINNWL
jgi:hypothetical protein